jgi:hypothetical protein
MQQMYPLSLSLDLLRIVYLYTISRTLKVSGTLWIILVYIVVERGRSKIRSMQTDKQARAPNYTSTVHYSIEIYLTRSSQTLHNNEPKEHQILGHALHWDLCIYMDAGRIKASCYSISLTYDLEHAYSLASCTSRAKTDITYAEYTY